MKLFGAYLVIIVLAIVSCSNDNEKKYEKTDVSNNQVSNNQSESESHDNNINKTSTDSQGSDEVTLSNLPRLKSIEIKQVSDNLKDGFIANVSAFETDGGLTYFRYRWKKNGEIIDGADEEILIWQDDFKRGVTISLGVTPFNSYREGAWENEVDFTIPNSYPEFLSLPPNTIEDGKFHYRVIATDPDGDDIEITLNNAPEGMSFDKETGIVIWEFDQDNIGNYKFSITTTDSYGATATQNLDLNIE